MNSSVPQPDQPLVLRDQLPLSRHYVAPRTPTEQRLAEIWRTVLSMDVVGVEDDYYDLGGDSLLATTMFTMIEQTFQVAIPIATLVESPSIAEIAPRIEALLRDAPTGKLRR
jgi:acyl carrier protein